MMKRKSKSYNSKVFLTLLAFLLLLFTSITPLFAQDTDGDGIADATDLDDDNDGILDSNEGCIPSGTIVGNGTFTNVNVDSPINIISPGNPGASFNSTSDILVVHFDYVIPAGTVITIDTDGNNGGSNRERAVLVQESNSTGTALVGATGVTISHTSSADLSTNYTTLVNTQYLRIEMTVRGTGTILDVDYISFPGGGCVDTDGDGITDNLDLDSDADSCPDALEGANNLPYTNLSPSTMAGGSTSIQDHLGKVVDANGVPTVVSGGQAIGSSIDNTTEGPGCADTDSDTLRDYLDVDDDNDGILDINEGCHMVFRGTFIPSPTGVSVNQRWECIGGIDNAGAQFNGVSDRIIGNFNTLIPAGGLLRIQTFADTAASKTLLIEQSNAAGTVTANPLTITHTATTSKNTYYTLSAATQYIKVSMTTNTGGEISLDFVEYEYLGPCTLDTDGDGIVDALDLDSDDDGCADALEGTGNFVSTDTSVSTVPAGTSGVVNNLGNTIETNGLPTSAGSGQYYGEGRDSTQLKACTDTDGDTLMNDADLDDDNDGILDTHEGCDIEYFGTVVNTPVVNILNAATVANLPIINNSGPGFNLTSHELVVDFNRVLPAGALITLRTVSINGSNAYRIFQVKECNATGTPSATSPGIQIIHEDLNIYRETEYVLNESTQYLRINLTHRKTGFLMLDFIQYEFKGPCTQNTDGDALVDALDLDSDDDNCPDALEGNGGFSTSQLVTSSVPVGGTPVQDNLGNTIDANGIPTLAGSSGQYYGFGRDASNTVACTDTDSDGVADNLDLDDDNDGILDTNEGCSIRLFGYPIRFSPVSLFTGGGALISSGIDGAGTTFDRTTAVRVVDFNKTVPAGALIKIETFASTADYKSIVIEQSNSDGTITSNPLSINHTATTSKNTNYTLTAGTQYIKITMPLTRGGYISVDFMEYSYYGTCRNTDGDALVDALDLDSDGDSCPDALEGTGSFTTANTVASSVPVGATAINANLGNTVGATPTTIGVPTIAGSGQNFGESRNATFQSACLDSDSDTVLDKFDLDDDNDGILDVNEGCNVLVTGIPLSTFPVNTTLSTDAQAIRSIDGINNNGAYINEAGQTLVLDFGKVLPQGALINVETRTISNNTLRVMLIEESNALGTVTSNPVYIVTNDVNTSRNTDYILGDDTQYLKVSMTQRINGATLLDHVQYQYTTPCTQDIDGDTIPDYLDLDTDADNCPDAVEGDGGFLIGSTVASSMPGGSTSIQNNLGTTVDGNGVPSAASGGQELGGSTDATIEYSCQDSDGDTIVDSIDLDDDNDGILDVTEGGGPYATLSGNGLFPVNVGVIQPQRVFEDVGDGAEFNSTGDVLVVDLGVILPAITRIQITTFSFSNDFKSILVEESNADGTITSNPITIEHPSTPAKTTSYVLAASTRYLKFSMPVNNGNRIEVDHIEYAYLPSMDTDDDGIVNSLDLDSDGDGCPDAVESATATALVTSGTNANDGIVDDTENALVNTAVDPLGTNGYANSLENVDTNLAAPVNAYIATNYNTYALDDMVNGCGVPVITQVYRNGTERWIELTNESTSNVLVPNGANLNLFSSGTTTARTATGANTAVLAPGESLLFESGATPTITPLSGVTRIVDAGLTNISNTSDIVSISRSGLASSTLPWDSRIDVITGIDNNTALVRTDEILAPNTTFTGTEWVTFVDDALSPYANPPQRHPHAPLISEIAAASSQSNITLGRHRFGPTNRTGSVWDNGDPDRTREVIIDEDYSFSTDLKARNLVVDNNSIVSANGSLLVVSDGITLSNANDEIRLRGASQLIQTHTGTTQISGDGKLLKDQNSPTPSTYRYNYFSSPVHTIGGTDYNVASVLKDGTSALSSAGVIGTNIAKDISFVTGLDGNTTDPIEIAERWLYTYPSAVNSYWSWNKISSTDAIPPTDGFIMKGPGRAQNYTFMGTPKDGELTTNIGANEFYLVGNPFPSALSAERFIRDNLGSITGDLLFWQHNGELANSGEFGHYYDGYIGGYAVRNLSMGIKADGTTGIGAQGTAGPISGTFLAPEPYIPVGQGFVIIGNGTGGPIVFNNSQREFIGEGAEGSNTSIFFRNNSKTPHAKNTSNESGKLPIIKLGIDYKNQDDLLLHRQIGISFSSENSFSYEKGYDSEIYQLGFTDIYWKFPNDDKNYVITGVQELTDNMEVPLEITMGADGELTMGIDQITNIDKPTYIKDAFLNKTYLINKETRETISLPKGTYTNRFYLVFTDSSNAQGITLSTEENQELKKDIQVRVDKKTNDILIENNSDAYIEKVTLYNILGQVIKQWDTLKQSEKHRLKVKNTANQVYIITIQTNKGSFSKKLINHGKKVVLHNTKELPEENTKITNPELEQKPETRLTSTIQNTLD